MQLPGGGYCRPGRGFCRSGKWFGLAAVIGVADAPHPASDGSGRRIEADRRMVGNVVVGAAVDDEGLRPPKKS